jgi:hypothetical protein
MPARAQTSPKISGDLRTAKGTDSNGTLLVIINATQLIGVLSVTCWPIMSTHQYRGIGQVTSAEISADLSA